MKKENFARSLNVLDGVITYNSFDIDENKSFEEQWYNYSEDILQIEFGDRFLLDVGWYPASDPKGKFTVYAILDQDWDNPVTKIKCSTLGELKKIIERTAIFINEMRKIKDIPPRDIEYEKFE